MSSSSGVPRTVGFLERAAERANPVLVKEVRAALRGKAFAIGFVVVLVLAMVASSIAMLVSTIGDEGTPSGVGYLIAVSIVFGLGAHGLVPFSAMASMTAEHDENSLELLQLSGISPARLVLGKLGAAAVQCALIYAAFLPFLSFAFLLEGVDLGMLAGGIAGSFVVSLTLSSLGIMLGAVLRVRWMRVLGFVALAITMIVVLQVVLAFVAARAFGGIPGVVSDHLLGVAVAGLVAATCCVYATARLQHAEENRSTAFRVLGTVALAIACAFGIASGRADTSFVWILVGLGFAAPSMILGVTEAERLPRAVLARARRKGSRAIAAPWMPGGGRGVLLVAANCAIALVAAAIGAAVHGGASWMRALLALAAVEVWVAIVVLLPSGAAAAWLHRPAIQVVARGAIPLFAMTLALVPTFGIFLVGGPVRAFEHPGNPAHFAERLLDGKPIDDFGNLGLLLLALLVAIAINVPRVLRSLAEVPRARAHLRTHPEAAVAESQR